MRGGFGPGWWIRPKDEAEVDFDPFERLVARCTVCEPPYILGKVNETRPAFRKAGMSEPVNSTASTDPENRASPTAEQIWTWRQDDFLIPPAAVDPDLHPTLGNMSVGIRMKVIVRPHSGPDPTSMPVTADGDGVTTGSKR